MTFSIGARASSQKQYLDKFDSMNLLEQYVLNLIVKMFPDSNQIYLNQLSDWSYFCEV